MTLTARMANIGSEVERALRWSAKGNPDYSRMAFERALELIDLSLACSHLPSHLKETARLREALVDYFAGPNEFGSSESSWKSYFTPFTYAARRTP
jgi:hypothetical protein